MIAIEVKYYPETNTRGAKFTASTCNGHKCSMSRGRVQEALDYNGGMQDEAQFVAQELANKMEWRNKLVGGVTKDGYAFCLTPIERN